MARERAKAVKTALEDVMQEDTKVVYKPQGLGYHVVRGTLLNLKLDADTINYLQQNHLVMKFRGHDEQGRPKVDIEPERHERSAYR